MCVKSDIKLLILRTLSMTLRSFLMIFKFQRYAEDMNNSSFPSRIAPSLTIIASYSLASPHTAKNAGFLRYRTCTFFFLRLEACVLNLVTCVGAMAAKRPLPSSGRSMLFLRHVFTCFYDGCCRGVGRNLHFCADFRAVMEVLMSLPRKDGRNIFEK